LKEAVAIIINIWKGHGLFGLCFYHYEQQYIYPAKAFISRIKDSKEKLKNPDYKLHELHFISTCISLIRNRSPCLKFSGKQTEKPLFPILSVSD
jgi:hypothetical protein